MPTKNRKLDNSLKREREEGHRGEEAGPVCKLGRFESIHPQLRDGCGEEENGGVEQSPVSDGKTLSEKSAEQASSFADGRSHNEPRGAVASNFKEHDLSSVVPSQSVASEMDASKLRSFSAVLAKTKLAYRPSVTGGVFLEDTDVFCVKDLPEVCEVTRSELQDDFLREGYSGLPCLRAGNFLPWSSTAEGPGQIMFSPYWYGAIPEMDIWRCTEAIQFVQCGRYVNPSRASPLSVNAKRMTMKGSRFRLNVDTNFAICVTCICVTDSYLYRLPSAGIPQRQVRGIIHSQEWERLVAFFCMVFNEKDLHAQLFQDALTFSTKPQTDGRAGPSQGFFKSASPTTSQASFKDPFVKDFGDEVPVYDGREVGFDFNNDLPHLPDKLPRFDGEIPRHSFAVIGYSAAKWVDRKQFEQFTANLQWAIVMGVPV